MTRTSVSISYYLLLVKFYEWCEFIKKKTLFNKYHRDPLTTNVSLMHHAQHDVTSQGRPKVMRKLFVFQWSTIIPTFMTIGPVVFYI